MERNEKTYVRTKGLGGDRKTEIEDRRQKTENTRQKTRRQKKVTTSFTRVLQLLKFTQTRGQLRFSTFDSRYQMFVDFTYSSTPFPNRTLTVRVLLTNFYEPRGLKMKLFRCEWSTASGRLRNPEPN